VQAGFSIVPLGERINYVCKRVVTKSLPTNDEKFRSIVCRAEEHLGVLQRCRGRAFSQAMFYEFGAGPDLIIPLAFYGFGIEHQILVDIRKLSRVMVVNHTIGQYRRTALDMPRTPERRIARQGDLVPLLMDHYGIDYRAPCDARDTGIPSGSIDCITSTNTLEHIPRADIVSILRECRRILQDDGLVSLQIDYQDHYAYCDGSISVYNFLQYSERRWKLFNPGLHYQNRLRHRDYLALVRDTGFKVIEERRCDSTAADLDLIERLSINKCFRHYTREELTVRSSHIVLQKELAH